MSGKVAPVSLRDIMSEELAKKLNETETEIVEELEEEIDDDLRLALELSKLEYDNQNKNSNATQEITENDILLAQTLQAELEREMESERYARSLQEQERKTAVKLAVQDPRSKVSVSYGYSLADLEDEEEDYDSEDELDDEISEESLSQFVIPTKPYHETTKVNGRVPKEIITKHDPMFAAMKNVEAMERTMESGNLSQSGFGVTNPVYNSLKEAKKVQTAYENRVRGNRADNKTSEQVLDHTTRVNLLKMLNSGVLSDLNGIISTGKEANVYYAKAGNKLEPEFQEGTEYAIKIYKTTLNEFKNRSEYIEGEFRFRHSKKVNERKLIKLWAEKEMRNLKRMMGSVNVPTPVLLRENILVMKFIGKEGWAAPSLKDVPLTESKASELYTELCLMMRNLFQKCKLVHADLSEYNILYHKGSLCFIDCSQSVEHDHPKAFEFLKNDVNVMSAFFTKRGLSGILFPRELFEFITDINIGDDTVEQHLAQLRETALKREDRPLTEEESSKNTLFQNTFIPRTLSQIENPLDTDENVDFHYSAAGLSSPAKSVVNKEEESDQ